MEAIGTQHPVPLARTVRIAVRGIRIRFGRSLVTVAGVGLGVAFLMSNLAGQLVQRSVAGDREVRMRAALMRRLLDAEVGSLPGKTLAVWVEGRMSPEDLRFLAGVRADRPAAIVAHGADVPGGEPHSGSGLAAGASALIVLGDGPHVDASLAELTSGMVQPVVLDTMADRRYEPSTTAYAGRREGFFGERLEQEVAEQAEAAARSAARLRWIVVVSLLVTLISVSNAQLMSVTERFREIGTLKCLGALSSFIRTQFLIESGMIGFAGSFLGALAGTLLSITACGLSDGFGPVVRALPLGWLIALFGAGVAVGTVLSIAAALYPARFASRMLPAAALRSNV